MEDPLSHSQTGFLIIAKKIGEPLYLTCSDGIVEIIIKEGGHGSVKIAMRSTNPAIKFHRDAERMRRELGSWVRFDQREEGNGPI